MIPYLLAAVGGYLIGDSRKKSNTLPDYAILARGGKTDTDMDVQFIEYKDKTIMFEPHNKEYFTNDIEFESLQDAKDYIDAGSPDPSWDKFVYSQGLMAEGGVVDANEFDQLKKGDKIIVTFGSTISRDNEVELLVRSKNLVGKGKSYECEKITFVNTKNPNGVRYYAYKRKDGDVGFAVGDLAIYAVKIKKKYAEGGYLTEIIAKEKMEYVPFNHSLSDLKISDTGVKIEEFDLSNESMTLTIEVEYAVQPDEEEFTFKEYTFELYVDRDGYSISEIISNGVPVSKEESHFLENNRQITVDIESAIEKAMDDSDNEEDYGDYGFDEFDDYYSKGGGVRKQYIFEFVGGGYNTVSAKDKREAVKIAKQKYEAPEMDGKSKVNEKSFRISTKQDLDRMDSMFR